ncbi:hypothetical protein CRG98_008168 [Punica granatum]|uniref:Uncharacterized protein n=1 Tax=Punica granatum TaxID=22663 RepID=A0A2I0KSI5_PUNGR|nr:hypothetical protein CRG98_008168 [Punica granatum]
MGRANETRTRTGCPFSFIVLGISNSLKPRVSVNHGMTIMPLEDKIARNNAQESHGIKGRGAPRLRIGQGASRPPSQGHGPTVRDFPCMETVYSGRRRGSWTLGGHIGSRPSFPRFGQEALWPPQVRADLLLSDPTSPSTMHAY